MLWQLLLLLLLLQLANSTNSASGTLIEIPVGAVFDNNQVELKHAMFAALRRHNSSRFRLNLVYIHESVNTSHNMQQTICSTMLPQGMLAIFGSMSALTVDSVQNLVSVFHVPYITPGIVKTENPKSQDYVLNLRPRHSIAIISALEMYRWHTFAYVVNSHEGLHRFQETIRVYQRHQFFMDLNVQLIFISNMNNPYGDLMRLDNLLKPQSSKHIVVDLDPPELISDFLMQLREMGMNRREYHYLVTGLSAKEISAEGLEHSGVNLTGFQLLNFTHPHVQGLRSSWQKLCNDKHWNCNSRGALPLYEVALLMDGVEVFTRAMEALLSRDHTRRIITDTLRRGANKIDCLLHDANPEHKLLNTKVYAYQYLGSSASIRRSRLGEMLMRQMVATTFQGFSGSVAFDGNGFRSNFTIEVLELRRGGRFQSVGKWHTHRGIVRNLLKPSTNRTNLTGINTTKVLRVVTVEAKPFVLSATPKLGEPKLTGNDRFEGFCVEMFDIISKRLGINYVIHFVKDNKYGAKTEENPKEWNGMIGELLRGEADIALAPLTINPERAEVVDFTEPFLTFGISIMIKKPKKEKPGTFSFLQPLSPEVWAYIMAGCIGVSLGLYLCARLSPAEWQLEMEEETPPTQTVSRDFSLLNSLWFSFAAFVNQGVDFSPKSSGARIVASVWWFFTLIMIAYYTATLAACLTVELLKTPINSWADLNNQKNGIMSGTLNAGSTKNFFLTTKLPPFSEIGQNMEANKEHVYVNSTAAGVQKVRDSKGKYAFLLESKMNEYYNNLEPCDTMMVGQPFGDKGYGIATPNSSPLRELLNEAVLQLREEQIIAQLYKKWWIEKGQCMNDDAGSGGLSALAVINVAGVFYILVAGLGIALLMALLEFYYIAKREATKSRVTFAKVTMSSAREQMFGGQRCQETQPLAASAGAQQQAQQQQQQQQQQYQQPISVNSFCNKEELAGCQRDFAVPVHVHYNNANNEFHTLASESRPGFHRAANLM